MKNPLNILAKVWAYAAGVLAVAALGFGVEAFLPDDAGDREVAAGLTYLALGFGVALVMLTVAAVVQAAADLLAEPVIPAGHPEGFHDAFAPLHRAFEGDVRAWKAGKTYANDGSKYASVEDGWTGMAFLETCLKSSKKKGSWVSMPKKV